MIARLWHGWADREHADQYEELLKEEIFVGIVNRRIPGYRGIRLLRDDSGPLTEFITEMTFDSLDAVREFAGEDYEAAVVPPKARAILTRFDERSRHYQVEVERPADQGADPRG